MIYPFRNERRITLGFWVLYPPDIAAQVGHSRHRGIDFDTIVGEDVLAPEKMVVVFAGESRGLGVVGEGASGTWRIWHLSQLKCTTGQMVEEGQRIGISGSSGLAFGAHTHIELEYKGQFINWFTELEAIMSDFERWFKEVEAKAVEVSRITKVSRPGDGLGTIIANLEHCAFLTGKAKALENQIVDLNKSGWTEVAPRVKKALGY